MAAFGKVLFPEANTFSVDFHPIPYRGDPTGLDRHYIPCRSMAGPSVQTFFALEQESRCLCYANANLTRGDQTRRADAIRGILGTLSRITILSGSTSIRSSSITPSCRGSTNVASTSSPSGAAGPESRAGWTHCLDRAWTRTVLDTPQSGAINGSGDVNGRHQTSWL